MHGYHYNSDVVLRLHNISSKLNPSNRVVSISNHDLDTILNKYFIDFNLDKTPELNIGYTKEERDNLRQTIKNIVADAININH